MGGQGARELLDACVCLGRCGLILRGEVPDCLRDGSGRVRCAAAERHGAYLDLYGPQVLRDLILCGLGAWQRRGTRSLLLLFDPERGARFGEVIALELAQECEDIVVGEQSGSPINDL